MVTRVRSADPTSSNATAEQLLHATATLLSKRNNLDVSIADIATHSGLNSALIKYYFGNKEGLLMRLLERDAAHAMIGLRQLLSARASAPQKLRWHIKALVNIYYKKPYLNRLIHMMLHQGTEENAMRAREIFLDPMIAVYHHIISQGQDEQTLKYADPALLYYALVGACDHLFYAGTAREHILGQNYISEDMKESYIQLIEDMCLNGLLIEN